MVAGQASALQRIGGRKEWRMEKTVGLGKEESHYIWNRGNKNVTEAGETYEKYSL